MTPEARKLLSSTVRALRARLLADPPKDPRAAARHEQAAYEWLQRQVLRRCLPDAADHDELPGLFAGAPTPAATHTHLEQVLEQPGLAACWLDDMTPGWVHQYWNDPEREALDVRLSARGKLLPHEVASKTQLFTERYLAEWMLHNTLGPLWLAICRRNGWVAEIEASGALAALEARRGEWRERRISGAVGLTELMPCSTDLERRWAYYAPQPLPADAAAHAPDSVRDLRLLDPAVGCGHFLLLAFDLLFALYREEAAHRGESGSPQWSARAITEFILEHNLHGLDIDPRAVRIAAAALWLKARRTCREARPRRLGLVATDLRLSGPDGPAVAARCRELLAMLPGPALDAILAALASAAHVGSLLRLDLVIERALGDAPDRDHARSRVLAGLEQFLGEHTRGDDLGLGLGEHQPAPGVRLLRLLHEGRQHLVIGNPPYQSTARLADAAYVQTTYPRGKADLYAAFLERGLQLVRPGGMSALLTMRGWMFLRQFIELRQWLLAHHDLRALGDFDRGAFEDLPDERVSVAASVFRRAPPGREPALALQPTAPDDRRRDGERTRRKHAAVLAQVGRHAFHPASLAVVPEWPLVYWWDEALRARYHAATKLGALAPTRKGICTGDDVRTCRYPWEVQLQLPPPGSDPAPAEVLAAGWVPTIMGGKGRAWIEPLSLVLNWRHLGLENKVMHEARWGSHTKRVQNEPFYGRRGVAFTMIGAGFAARVHRYPSIFGNMGSSVFTDDLAGTVASMNTTLSRALLTSLNPGMHFEVGDVNRLPLFPIAGADEILATLERAFAEHESHREPSVEYRRPGPSPWRHAQAWAQRAVDRPAGAPLPAYTPEYDPEPATARLSHALGVALGRFGPAGEGLLDPSRDSLTHALPDGILFLDGTLAAGDLRDSLGHLAAAPLHASSPGDDLRRVLRHDLFARHRKLYENRPIHWPLSSAARTFVAWITIHRWRADTLHRLIAEHLQPALARLDAALTQPRQPARDELLGFIAAVRQCAEHGPPAPDPSRPEREVDAAYAPALDDGVRVNAAALWPLLAPQWKDPASWWRQLAGGGKQHADWSRLAMRYWPTRVDAACRRDPSLAVAHGCFYRYHPALAWAWELRLQSELGPDFRLAEPSYRGDGGHEAHRREFLADHPERARAIAEKEAERRLRRPGRRRPDLLS